MRRIFCKDCVFLPIDSPFPIYSARPGEKLKNQIRPALTRQLAGLNLVCIALFIMSQDLPAVYTLYIQYSLIIVFCQEVMRNNLQFRIKKKIPRRNRQGKISVTNNCCQVNYIALCTRPERRQRVQAFTLQGVPFTIALTFLTLGL